MAQKDNRRRLEWLSKAGILSEALPYMRKYADKIFVIKYGGHAMGDDALAANFARDIVLLKHVGICPIVVHGGGPQIGQMLERLKVKSEFVDGLRVTDSETVDVVEMVLAGQINKQIVTAINSNGGNAIGICGKDGNLLKARRLRRTQRDPDSNIERILDLGFVGEPTKVDPTVLRSLVDADLVPIVAPIGVGDNGETYNINADTAAGAIAGAIGATRLFMLTDVQGVLDGEGSFVADMTIEDCRRMMADKVVTGGMIPKLETCMAALEQSVDAAVILDGRVPHVLLLEIFTDYGVGTMIKA